MAARRVAAVSAAALWLLATVLPASASTAERARATAPEPAAVTADGRRLSVPAGAYLYGAQFGGMSEDGAHVFLDSAARLDTSYTFSGQFFASFDAVAGRILKVGPEAGGHVFTMGTSAAGDHVVVESNAPLVDGLAQIRVWDLYLVSGTEVRAIRPGDQVVKFVAISADGSAVVLSTTAQLDPADTDDSVDFYRWDSETGATALVSTGTGVPTFVRVAADGTRVVFTSTGQITGPALGGGEPGIYEWTDAGVALRGRGTFKGESADGSRLYFNTMQSLVAEDADAVWDAYVDEDGGPRVLSEPSTLGAALVSVADDGSRFVLQTSEPMTAEDTDSAVDAYLVDGGERTLLTRGTRDADWVAADASLTTGIYETAAALVPGDEGGQVATDVYRIALDDPSSPALISGDGGPDAAVHAVAYATAGDAALFTTYGQLLPADADLYLDLYEWRAGVGLRMVSPGYGGANLVAWTPDLRRVVFEALEALTPEATQPGVKNVWISDADLTPPTTTIVQPPTTTGPGTSIAFGTTGGDAAWFDCRLDDGDWMPCTSPFTATGMEPGDHSLGVRAWDAAANMDEASVGWTSVADAPPVAPTPSLTPLPRFQATQTIALAWGATPGSAPLASFDVRVKRAPWNDGYGAWSTWRSATSATSGTFTGTRGSTYCVSVRARDTNGLASGWTGSTCTAIPVDDRKLARSASWVAGTSSRSFAGTYVRSSTRSATLTLRGAEAQRIALLVKTCDGCGTVRVYWNGALLRTVSLDAGPTTYRRLVSVASFSTLRHGTLVVRITSSGRSVTVDGVVVRRSS